VFVLQAVMMDARLQMPSEVVRAVQPPELSAAFLHSEGTFVVATTEQTFLWVGKVTDKQNRKQITIDDVVFD
jgi:hypothetical protein